MLCLLSLGAEYAATRIHHASRRCDGHVALTARAQQPAMPVIGFLDSRAADAMTSRLGAFRQGLKELGFAEGENVSVVYRWAENRFDRLPELAAELVRRQATLLVT